MVSERVIAPFFESNRPATIAPVPVVMAPSVIMLPFIPPPIVAAPCICHTMLHIVLSVAMFVIIILDAAAVVKAPLILNTQ
jgi:hypothetical protein